MHYLTDSLLGLIEENATWKVAFSFWQRRQSEGQNWWQEIDWASPGYCSQALPWWYIWMMDSQFGYEEARTCHQELRQSMSAPAGDPDPYPWVYSNDIPIPGSVQVSATRWLGLTGQVPATIAGTCTRSGSDKYLQVPTVTCEFYII